LEKFCTDSGIVGTPGAMLATILLVTANTGYRICCEDQHRHEVPRVVLNTGRGIPSVRTCSSYIRAKSASSLSEIIMAEARWARRAAFLPYPTFAIWVAGIMYVWLPWTICYGDIHYFDQPYIKQTMCTVGMLVPLIISSILSSVWNFLCYHRLLLLDYCVEQRGDIEQARLQAEELQVRKELLGRTFSAWKDVVSMLQLRGAATTSSLPRGRSGGAAGSSDQSSNGPSPPFDRAEDVATMV
jgi:hypothetical protein